MLRSALVVATRYSPFLRRVALRLRSRRPVDFFFPGAESKLAHLFGQVRPEILLTTMPVTDELTPGLLG